MSTLIQSENIKKALAKLGMDEAGVTSALEAMTSEATAAGLVTKTIESTATLPDFETIIKTAVDGALAPVIERISALEALPAKVGAVEAALEVNKTATLRTSKTMGEIKELLAGAVAVGSGAAPVTEKSEEDAAKAAISKTEAKLKDGEGAVVLSGLGTKMFPRS